MNTLAPELAPLFRTDSQGEILAQLLLNPDRAFSIAELARVTGTSYASTHREVQRLIRSELLIEQRVGRTTQVKVVTTSPVYAPLTELLLLSYGPIAVIPKVLVDIAEIEEAYIYGSWAARRAGEYGSPPADIDVLVVGNPARSAMFAAAEEAERVLRREVNIRVVSQTAWTAGDDPFVRTVRQRPLAPLDLTKGRP